jgi:hypothetical protein
MAAQAARVLSWVGIAALAGIGIFGVLAWHSVTVEQARLDDALRRFTQIRQRLYLLSNLVGGEGGIRTQQDSLESVSYRFHNARLAVNASDAVAPCTLLHGGRGWRAVPLCVHTSGGTVSVAPSPPPLMLGSCACGSTSPNALGDRGRPRYAAEPATRSRRPTTPAAAASIARVAARPNRRDYASTRATPDPDETARQPRPRRRLASRSRGRR